ncbi:MAG TPA: alpha/beta hydrolase-fold protein [Cyclobacteriaceae bacterium]|nr:alpha/beta hydrolase-fold protein [Cyclobacteriaceae bacterium]
MNDQRHISHCAGNFWKIVNVLLVLVCLANGSVVAQKDSVITLGKKFNLRSRVLKETREIWILTPPYYKENVDRYPVLFVLDAGGHYKHIAATVEYLSDNLRIPEMIVVGIPNTDRIRDFTPLHSLEGADGKVYEELFRTSGGGDAFVKFLKSELIPYLDEHYRTQPFRVIEAHSLAGTIAMHALEQDPQLFQAFIFISPAIYGKNVATLEKFPAFLKANPTLSSRLFVSIGSEPMLESTFVNFVRYAEANKPATMKFESSRYPMDDHGSVAVPAMFDGLRFIYPDWRVNSAREDTLTGDHYKAHFEKLSGYYGYEILPPQQLISSQGQYCLELGNMTRAIGFFKMNVANYPTSSVAYYLLGNTYRQMNEVELAIGNLDKALELDPKNTYISAVLKGLKTQKK